MKKRINMCRFNFLKVTFVLTAFILATATVSKAQISAEDSALIWKKMNSVSDKIEAELKINKALYDEMKAALKDINLIKDTALLDAALASYRSKYLSQYSAAVKKAGVDISLVASELKSKIPNCTFRVNNDFSLEVETVRNVPVAEYKETVTTTTTTTSITSFDKDKDEGCGVVAGSSVSFGTRKVHTHTKAILAGYCSSSGQIINETNIPSGAKTVALKMKYTLRTKGYAVATPGVASCGSSGSLSVEINTSTPKKLVDDLVDRHAIAPVAWYARYDKEKDYSHTIDLAEYEGKTLKIKGRTWAAVAVAIVSATGAHGYSTITKADLIITK